MRFVCYLLSFCAGILPTPGGRFRTFLRGLRTYTAIAICTIVLANAYYSLPVQAVGAAESPVQHEVKSAEQAATQLEEAPGEKAAQPPAPVASPDQPIEEAAMQPADPALPAATPVEATDTPPAPAPESAEALVAQEAASPEVPVQAAQTPETPPKQLAAVTEAPAKQAATQPPQQASEAAAPKRIQLFGTVEFKGHFKTLTQWINAMEENKKNPIFTPGSKLNASTTWDTWKKELEKMTPMEQIKAVNTFWNKWPYRLDKAVYGKEDYWAAPYLFRKNSGDCEDYCIAKYYTLRELGFSPDQLRIVIVMEKIRNIAHAVLVVYLNDDAYILDNLNPYVVSHTKSRNYAPQYSVNEEYRWAHVLPKKP